MRLTSRIPALWPPQPYTLASAAARVAEALAGGSRRRYTCFAAIDVAGAGRGMIAAVPVEIPLTAVPKIAGSLCLGGTCKASKDLCSDSTQCKSGTSCVDGRCVSKCTSTCASGYKCDDKTGLCTGGTGACSAEVGCDSGGTCVGSRCVAPAKTDGTCGAGLVSVAGGCVVDDRPIFFCDNDGTKDGTQDKCATGSICLHHNCYISCTGASDTTTCAKADKFPTCKSVTTSSGAHNVCGSSTSLGSECDPTATPPKACASGKVCIDGFCK